MKTEVAKWLLQERARSPPEPWPHLACQAVHGFCTHSPQTSSFSESPSLQDHILKPVYFDLSLRKNRTTCQQIAELLRKIHLLLWLLNIKSENRGQRTSRGMDCFLSILYLCHPCYLSHMDSPAFPFWQHWCPLGRWQLGGDVTRQD